LFLVGWADLMIEGGFCTGTARVGK